MPLKREIYDDLLLWKRHKTNQALLVTGARQVGKTFIVREFGRGEYRRFVEFNLLLDQAARDAFAGARSADDLQLRIEVAASGPLEKGETLVFIDEVQECPEIVTYVKGLVDRGDYDYVLSGSMLGVELEGIRSAPVGYLSTLTMYPLSFEEFCWASGLADEAIGIARDCIARDREIPGHVHERLLALFHRYLAVGGMPDVVRVALRDGNVDVVRRMQADIRSMYERDISKYAPATRRLVIRDIYRLIPAELQSQSRRFKFSSIPHVRAYDQIEDEFLWLADANVALPAYNVAEPSYPLLLNKRHSMFKLFSSDVGLLMGTFAKRDALDLYRDGISARLGGVYENFVAQELVSQGRGLYYFTKRDVGELDLVVESDAGEVVAFEVKSGRGYRTHKALDNALARPGYGIDRAYVLAETNVARDEGGILYLPVYGVGLIDLT